MSSRAAASPPPPGRRAGAAFFLLMALTPVIPYIKVPGVGLALNDFPPILAVGFGTLYVVARYRRGRAVPVPIVALITAEIALLAGASAVANGLVPKDLLGGPIRWTETTLLIALAFIIGGDRELRSFFLRAATIIATVAGLIGIAAFVLRFEGPYYLGIEAFRTYQSLYGVFPGRITSTLGLPSSGAAALFALTLPIAVGYAIGSQGQERIRWVFAAMTLSVALLFTFGRVSTVLGLGLVVVLLAVRLRPQIAVTAGAAAVFIVLGSALRARFLADSNDRLALWTAALQMPKGNPLFGVGPTQYEDRLPEYDDTPFGIAGSTAHNSLLEAAATLGIAAGILLTLAILVALLTWLPAALRRRFVAPEEIGAWLGLAGFALSSLTVNFFFWPQLGLLFWTMAMALSRLSTEPAPTQVPVSAGTADVRPTAARRAHAAALSG